MLSNSLKAFYETVRMGSIRKASEKMGVAPSSISRQIALLERQIGTELLERSPGGTRLTHAGRLVADFAGPALFDYEALRSDLNDLRGHRRRLIRVCATASAIYMDVSATMLRFQEKYESTVFQFDCLNAEDAVRAVRAGDFDVAIALCADPHPDVEVLDRIAEPCVLAVASDHPMAHGQSVQAAAFASLDFALLSESYVVRKYFDEECRRVGVVPNVILESGNVNFLIDFVRLGHAATIVPARTLPADRAAAGLRVMEIDVAPFNTSQIEVLVARNRRLATVVRRFVEMLSADLAKQAVPAAGPARISADS